MGAVFRSGRHLGYVHATGKGTIQECGGPAHTRKPSSSLSLDSEYPCYDSQHNKMAYTSWPTVFEI